jgi:hypothetical protein
MRFMADFLNILWIFFFVEIFMESLGDLIFFLKKIVSHSFTRFTFGFNFFFKWFILLLWIVLRTEASNLSHSGPQFNFFSIICAIFCQKLRKNGQNNLENNDKPFWIQFGPHKNVSGPQSVRGSQFGRPCLRRFQKYRYKEKSSCENFRFWPTVRIFRVLTNEVEWFLMNF